MHLTHMTSRPLDEIGVGNLSINIGRNLCKIQQIIRSAEFITSKIFQLGYGSKTHPISQCLNLNFASPEKKSSLGKINIYKHIGWEDKTKLWVLAKYIPEKKYQEFSSKNIR